MFDSTFMHSSHIMCFLPTKRKEILSSFWCSVCLLFRSFVFSSNVFPLPFVQNFCFAFCCVNFISGKLRIIFMINELLWGV